MKYVRMAWAKPMIPKPSAVSTRASQAVATKERAAQPKLAPVSDRVFRRMRWGMDVSLGVVSALESPEGSGDVFPAREQFAESGLISVSFEGLFSTEIVSGTEISSGFSQIKLDLSERIRKKGACPPCVPPDYLSP